MRKIGVLTIAALLAACSSSATKPADSNAVATTTAILDTSPNTDATVAAVETTDTTPTSSPATNPEPTPTTPPPTTPPLSTAASAILDVMRNERPKELNWFGGGFVTGGKVFVMIDGVHFAYSPDGNSLQFALASDDLKGNSGTPSADVLCGQIKSLLEAIATSVHLQIGTAFDDVVSNCVGDMGNWMAGNGGVGHVIDLKDAAGRLFAAWFLDSRPFEGMRLVLNLFWNPTDDELQQSD